MNGPQTFPKLSQKSLEEHAVIQFHLEQLERALKNIGNGPVDADALRTIAVRLDSFKERLEEHFAGEEDGGLLQGVQDALPQAESDVKRFRSQHARMMESLDGIRQRARRGDPSDLPVLVADLERLLATIRGHEQEEDALVKRALRQD